MKKDNNNIRSTVFIALFSATAIALGYALVALPNIELVTATLFVTGMILGWKRGIYVAVITYLVFSLFNPFGFPNPLLLIAQVIGAIIAVVAGDLSNKYDNPIFFFFSGFSVTLIYDVITNITGYLVFVSKQTFIAYLVGGLSFAAVHIVSNILIFIILLYPLRNEIKKLRS